jgi:hypothetical protein
MTTLIPKFNLKNGASTPNGAINRAINEKLADVVSVKDFGAIGDGTTNDTAAFQAAVNANKAIYIPQGTYVLTSQISFANNSISIIGDGIGVSVLKWTSAVSNGFYGLFTNTNVQVTIQNISIRTAVANGGNAINLTFSNSPINDLPSLICRNVQISYVNNATDYWTNGIVLASAWNVVIESTWIVGKTNTFSMQSAITFTDECIVASIIALTSFFTDKAINIKGHAEGIGVVGCTLVYHNYGVYTDVAGTGVDVYVTDSHISTFVSGVYLYAKSQSFVSANLFYKREDSTSDYTAIYVENSDSCQISNNILYTLGGSTGTSTGTYTKNSNFLQISTNLYIGFTQGIKLDTGTAVALVVANTFGQGTVDAYIDATNAGLGNVLLLNTPPDAAGIQKLTANSATPSIKNNEGNVFTTDNSVATTITNFPDGYSGQRILIIAQDANTTIQHNANISLAGGVNFVMASNQNITLQRADVWREVSRTS